MARGLGRGLDAFFPEIKETSDDNVQEIPIDECRPNPYQPRKTFHADAIEELTDERMTELALLENLQREDLSPIEEAHAYSNLMNELDITQEELSKRLGKSRSHIANITRLLSLPNQVIAYINNGELSMGHGRALLAVKDEEKLAYFVNRIRKEHLNVRQVEQLIQDLNKKPEQKPDKPKKDIFLQERESVLRNKLGTSVKINRGKRKGKIEIEFYTDEDLNRIIDVLEN